MAKRPTPSSPNDGPWMTRAELARHHGIARSTVTRRVDSLKAVGNLRTKNADDGSELISLASYDHEVARTIDGVRSGASRARKERKAEKAQRSADEPDDTPMIFRGLPGQREEVLFILLDEIAPGLAKLLDEQNRVLERLKDSAPEIAALAHPHKVEAALIELWREMRDASLAANETCGFPYVRAQLWLAS